MWQKLFLDCFMDKILRINFFDNFSGLSFESECCPVCGLGRLVSLHVEILEHLSETF